MSVVGVRRAAAEGEAAMSAAGFWAAVVDRADLDAYLGRPVPTGDADGRERVEALYCQVSGSTGRSRGWPIRNGCLGIRPQRRVFQAFATGDRDCGSRLPDSTACLMMPRMAASPWCGWCGQIGWRVSGVAWIERYLSVCGVSVEALHDRGDTSQWGKLMDDFMAMSAPFSGRFYQLRSRRNQQRLLDAASERLAR
jgi:putative resolvase